MAEKPTRESEERLPTRELVARYLAMLDWMDLALPGPAPETWALSIWEDWIEKDPERSVGNKPATSDPDSRCAAAG